MKTVIVIIFTILVNTGFASCIGDNNTLTEKLFYGTPGTIFTCKVISSDQNKDGELWSMVEVDEIFFGSVESKVVKINTGSHQSSARGRELTPGEEYIIYTSGSGGSFGCCSICDRWTKDVKKNKEEIETLRKFSEIFKKKKSGKFQFFYPNKKLAAVGEFKKGKPIGTWKHYYETGILKTENNLSDGTWKIYYKSGLISNSKIQEKDKIITISYSDSINGQIKYKTETYPNDSGYVSISYRYFENGKVDKISGTLIITKGEGDSSKEKTGKYEEYYKNGNLKLKGQFKKSRRVGIWTWYHENGAYYAEFDYKDGTGPQ